MAGWQVAVAVVVGAPALALGLLLVVKGPRVVGLLVLALGLLPLSLLSPDPPSPGATAPHGLALVLAVASVAGWVWLYLPPALLAAVFPDGRLGGGWWFLPAGWLLFLLTFHLGVALDPGTYGTGSGQVPGDPPADVPGWVVAALGALSLVLLLALLVGSAARVAVRFRNGDQVVRRQLKWFLLSILLLPAVLVVGWAAYLLTDVAEVVVVVGLLVVYVSLPISVAIAIFRHDLYDVDTLLSRTVAYLVLTGVVVAVFAVMSVATGAAVGGSSGLAVAAATLVATLLFGLLRRRVQSVVDARFDHGRTETVAGLDDFLDAVRDGRAEPEQVEAALRQALRDPALVVAYRVSSEDGVSWRRGDAAPVDRPGQRSIDVVVAGRVLACVGYETAGRRPRVLGEALRRARLPLELAHSRLSLRQALTEVRASRARLVEATDAERRRLERDLHDGAQQRLVAIGMSLQLAGQRAGAEDPMQPVLAQAVRDLREAVAELRRLASGVRPRGLDEGLSAAVRDLVRTSPVPVNLEVTDDPVPETVATTAYYVVAEALANALKHGSPTAVAIGITRENGDLRVVVSDDGRGGAAEQPGSGLAGLRDRVAASGGDLVVESLSDTGTRMEARLPCG